MCPDLTDVSIFFFSSKHIHTCSLAFDLNENIRLFPLLKRTNTNVPKAHCITYDCVQYLINKHVKILSNQQFNVFRSLLLWNNNLFNQQWNTFLPVPHDSPDFVFAFQSLWQKSLMLIHSKSMLMIDATHNMVNNYSLGNNWKVSLYTFLICNPVLGESLMGFYILSCKVSFSAWTITYHAHLTLINACFFNSKMATGTHLRIY